MKRCAQALAGGWTSIYSWTDFTAAEVQAYCADFSCATYVAP